MTVTPNGRTAAAALDDVVDAAPPAEASTPAPANPPRGGLAIEDLGEPRLGAGAAGEAPPAPGAPAGAAPGGVAIPAVPRWTPEEAALVISGGINSAGVPMFFGEAQAYERDWRVKEAEVDPWAASAARLLDRTPFAPGAAGAAGLVADGLVVLGGLFGVAMPRVHVAKERTAAAAARRGQRRKGRGEAASEGPAAAAGTPRRPETTESRPRSQSNGAGAARDGYVIPDDLIAAAGAVDGDAVRHGGRL